MELHLGRRLTAVFIGIALIVALFFVPFAEGKATVSEGTEKAKSVESLSDFASVLSTGMENGTIKQEYSYVFDQDVKGEGTHIQGVERLHVSLERYTTKEGSLTVLKGDSYEYGSAGTEQTTERSRLLVDLTYYQSTKVEFLRIDRLQATVNGKIFTGEERLAHQWVRIDRKKQDADYSLINQLMSHMFDVFSMEDVTESLPSALRIYKEDDFNIDNDVYTLKEDKIKESFSGMGVEPKDLNCEFKVDLSDKTAPTAFIGVESKVEEKEDSSSSSTTLSQESKVSLSDIGNTVVAMPDLFIEIDLNDFNDIIKAFFDVLEG